MSFGYYYLHENGELIYKRDFDGTAADLRESDLVRMFWPCNPCDREQAWRILVEASALGARAERVAELAAKWKCNDDDAQVFAERIGVSLRKDVTEYFAARRDFVDLQTSPAGFGPTALAAMADLARALGYRAQKTWGASFADLCKVREGGAA